jgi:hypothetical protein
MLGNMVSGDAYEGWFARVPAAVGGIAPGLGAGTPMVPGWPNTSMRPFDDADGWMAG